MPTIEEKVRAHLERDEPNYTVAAKIGPPALPVLETLVRGADPLLAAKAAYLAALIGGPDAARVIDIAASSGDATVRVAAAAAIEQQPDLSEDTAADLATDPDPGVRKIALRSARAHGGRLRKRMAERARTGDQDTRDRALGALAELDRMEDGTAAIEDEDHGGGPSPGGDAADTAASGEGGGEIGTGSSDASPSDDALRGEGGGDIGGGAGNASQSEQSDDESGGGGGGYDADTRDGSIDADPWGPDGGGDIGRH